MRENEPYRRDWGSLALCVLLSLLLHAGLAWALDLLPRSRGSSRRPSAAPVTRHVQVVRPQVEKKKPQQPPATEGPKTEAPFAKTSPDEVERRPQQADFIGSRDSTAGGEPDAPQRSSEAPLPTMAGRESEEEVVTFDQERQDGDLTHEGLREEAPPTPPQAVAQGSPDGASAQAELQGEGVAPPQPAADATAALHPQEAAPGEGLKLAERLTEEALTLTPQLPPPAPEGQPEGKTATSPSAPQPRVELHDPTLAAHVRQQPGLRTYERRTRSTGRFVFGRRPALNVAATPRGHYEAEIYRRIARMWYAACDDHRGDIIPGSITVSLRLTKSGNIDSMALVRRRGASLLQQSFSFGAIRHATLPPMPHEVQQSLIGRLYEMILTFNFD